ncbi:MAG: ABC transporter permease, partial [Nitrososphaerota archaeon]|nr:ABC transporter permease [Nitrososphaerota archaeon]
SDITNAFSNRKLLSGTVITATFVLIAIFGPFVVSNPVQPALDLAYLPPSLRFPLGTDNWGRSVLAELVWGSRISLTVGVVSATAATLIGTLVGLVAGYFGGIVGEVMMRLTDIMLIIPPLALMILLAVYLGPSETTVIFIIAITAWPFIARTVRSEVLTRKNRTYVHAAKVTGVGTREILFSYILPDILPVVLANAVLTVTAAIVAEATLDFIGVGVTSIVSWGEILYWAQQSAFYYNAWWWILSPGLAIGALGTGFMMIGLGVEEITGHR